MSDSEADDAWKAVLLSRTKLNEVKQRLRNLEEDDQFTKNSVELVIKTQFATPQQKQFSWKHKGVFKYIQWERSYAEK